MVRRSEPVLVLWDIDQTLISTRGLSRRIYETAFRRVTGVPLRYLVDMAGRTERAILRETLMLHGLAVPDSELAQYFQAIAAAAEALRSEMRRVGHALPGAADAISALTAAGAVQTVVTGNLRQVSVTKLDAFGLGPGLDFEIGGYGDEGEDRAALVRWASRRASDAYDQDFSGERVVVIGDTSHDIRAARDTGVRSIGVATGRATAQELAKVRATAVFEDLTDVPALVAAVLRAK